MGLALVFLFVSLCIGAAAYGIACVEPRSDRPFRVAIITTAVFVAIFGIIGTAAVVGDSYSSYLDNRAFYDATLEQYRGSVKMYKDHAVIDMNKTRAAFTDFKYQGYQGHMSKMIIALQRRIVKYNRSFMLKKIKNDSWFFNWYIITNDPDMKIIRMIEKGQKVKLSLP